VLNLADGSIKPNPDLPADTRSKAEATIERLELNDPEDKKMRARHFDDYCTGIPEWYLWRYSPFVWHEANRQGLL
jgi:hypothetical protein